MTEKEWLECTNSARMLEFQRSKISTRQLRLFTCACARHLWPQLSDKRSHQAVVIGERFAEGATERKHLETALANAKAAAREARSNVQEAARQPGASRGDEGFQLALRAEEAARIAQKAVEADAWRAAIQVADTWATSERRKTYLLVHEIIGNPFRPVANDPAWFTTTLNQLAGSIYSKRAFDRLPILADALEEAGCNSQDILSHCRQPGEHVLVYSDNYFSQ
jgi:hypothetical protein